MSVTDPADAHVKYEIDWALASFCSKIEPTPVFPKDDKVGVCVGEGVGVGVAVTVGLGVAVGLGRLLILASDVVTRVDDMIAAITNITISNLIAPMFFSVMRGKVIFGIGLAPNARTS